MFADIVGSTALSGRIDPETLRTVLAEYHSSCSACITRFGGTVLKYLGDGILAIFGYPQAHENDAERAVLAGLAMVNAMRALRLQHEPRHGFGLDGRIGIHTGLVVIGEMAVGDARVIDAIGETPNIAARVQGEAAPNSVCVSSATRALLKENIELASLGQRALKGVSANLELFEVHSVSAEKPEFRQSSSATPLLGRSPEQRQLTERWLLAREGNGQAVLLSGEGGIGKSRLLKTFREHCGVAPGAWWNVFCSPFSQNSALRPMIELIERTIAAQAPAEAALDRAAALRTVLQQAGLGDAATVGLVRALLGLGGADEPALRNLTPDQRKRRTFDALIAWLQAAAARHPLILAVEDLHWVDASTREFLGVLLERIGDLPVLVVLTFRPEFVPTWALHGQIATLSLSRLPREQSVALVTAMTGGKPLPARLVDEILQRTDGIPLFVEELTKAILASGAVEERDGEWQLAGGAAAPLEVPATLRDSLTARLDRLGGAKLVAQVGAVLGREFHYAALHAVCELADAELEAQLAALNRAEIVHQRGVPPQSHYVFKHALIQEAAYDTLLKSTRQHYHRRAAAAYVERFPDVVGSRPELIAHHYSRAAMPESAVGYWQRAGEFAVARSGYHEALGHLAAALEQVELLPVDAARKAIELGLRVKIGPALIALKGMSAPETGENYALACALAEQFGDSAERFMALWGDWLFKTQSGMLFEAAERSDQLVALSHKLGDDSYVLQAHHSRWTNLFNMGQISAARADAVEGMRLYDPERHREHKHLYGGHDPGVCAYGSGANTACMCGAVDEVPALVARAVAIASELDHPFSMAVSYVWACASLHGARDHVRARAYSDDFLGFLEKRTFPQWEGIGVVVAGASRCASGDTALGLKMVDEAVTTQFERGLAAWHQFVLVAAAEAHLQSGNYGRANDLLAEGLARSDKLRVRCYRSENLRLQAETLIQAKRIAADEAISRLEAACEIAHGQGATLLEWRTSISLARLLAQQGRAQDAKARLGGISLAAAGGVDCPDIREGIRLLAELG
jgi:class 3 adenylate cyclase/tetratricopeptide (TPR) repeat protein